jgi:hypothetical protein
VDSGACSVLEALVPEFRPKSFYRYCETVLREHSIKRAIDADSRSGLVHPSAKGMFARGRWTSPVVYSSTGPQKRKGGIAISTSLPVEDAAIVCLLETMLTIAINTILSQRALIDGRPKEMQVLHVTVSARHPTAGTRPGCRKIKQQACTI